jgi:uridylate kinase
MADPTPYRRVLVKISGEAMCLPGAFGIDPDAMDRMANELAPLHASGVQTALVLGAGNLLRGKAFTRGSYIPRVVGDEMGMLATVMNALAMREALEHRGIPTRVLSAVGGDRGFCEPFVRRRAVSHLEAGRFVILAGGTGSPFFTTDTCAALRAAEIGADLLLKATKVDGVFDADPVTHPGAQKFDYLTYGEVLTRQLGVMDLAAVSVCLESNMPVIVFRMDTPGNLARVARGERVGTVISTAGWRTDHANG